MTRPGKLHQGDSIERLKAPVLNSCILQPNAAAIKKNLRILNLKSNRHLSSVIGHQ